MIIELGILKDGRVLLVSDETLPDVVKRVEYYSDQHLLNLVYYTEPESSDLMHREVPVHMASKIEKSPEVVIYTTFIDHDPIGYKVPLIKIGEEALF